MAQTSYKGMVTVHASEAVEVNGTTDSGRELEIYLSRSAVEYLAKVIAFATEHKIHLGHAGWHIKNNIMETCESCENGSGSEYSFAKR